MLRLKELRTKAGLTQKELAEKSGLSQVAISKYEQGTRFAKIGSLEKLARALHTNVPYLRGAKHTMFDNYRSQNKLNEQIADIEAKVYLIKTHSTLTPDDWADIVDQADDLSERVHELSGYAADQYTEMIGGIQE